MSKTLAAIAPGGLHLLLYSAGYPPDLNVPCPEQPGSHLTCLPLSEMSLQCLPHLDLLHRRFEVQTLTSVRTSDENRFFVAGLGSFTSTGFMVDSLVLFRKTDAGVALDFFSAWIPLLVTSFVVVACFETRIFFSSVMSRLYAKGLNRIFTLFVFAF